ncbi:succinate dehydrogenase assembly factor 2 [Hydrogenovibrio sp. 3SP14C1]|uniref:FAD assembly factor SdhE n=1 Tax=Hydrogenovibrio sp. 3SP14C1 TaxID=3038774 RepID=UPI00241671E8|nr:succinate dehydrogenase assembly factor 2 [Hydrogenovibrio sp. 3SP14C1]MDG4811458.1 succinate dehydrogenase assembly factor 2 [Hydrogenovibrio sp. 3SP14C1]
MNNFDLSTKIKAIRLNCRRGNSESELLLQAYIDLLAENPDPEALHELSILVAENDQDLFHWLMTPTDAPQPYQELIKRIRQTYLKSP